MDLTSLTRLEPGEIFDRMERDDRWLGFGYLGDRRIVRAGEDPEVPARPELVAEVDAMVIEYATQEEWDYEDLFGWANSINGRYFGDILFGFSDSIDVRWQFAVGRAGLLKPMPEPPS